MHYRKKSAAVHKLAANANFNPYMKKLFAYLLIVSLWACSSNQFNRVVAANDFIVDVVSGDGFSHKIARNAHKGPILHVYIEGDGRPWISPISISDNPTPKNPIMLKLMALDHAPSIYLGRPCYFKVDDEKCNDSQWWTMKRYAPEIIDSLNFVLNDYAEHYQRIRLFGHSGGGTIAFLLARTRNDVLDLVTLAGNLDVDAWTKEHNYSTLHGSMNPAEESPVAVSVRQYHYVGTDDKIVPARLLGAVVAKQPNAELISIDSYDHACCWDQVWIEVLKDLDNNNGLPNRRPAMP